MIVKRLGLGAVVCLAAATTLYAQDRSAPRTAAPRTTAPATRTAPAAQNNRAQASAPAASAAGSARVLASYAIGYDLASRLRSEEANVDVESLIRGLKDSFSGAKPAYEATQLQAAVEAFDKEVQARVEARIEQLSTKNQAEGTAFQAKNKARRGVKTLPSGLQIEVLQSGKGRTPTATDTVRAHYHGTLIDGTVFDTTKDSEPIEINVAETIAGWGEALQMMRTGDKWRLTVPPELAYGREGYGPVPPGATLIFDIELVDIAAPMPPQQSARPRQLK